MSSLEQVNKKLDIEVTMIKEEQKQILTSYYDLEKRYKDIINENKQIKNEISDLRRNKSQLSSKKCTPIDMPFNKTSNYQTPNRLRDQHYL